RSSATASGAPRGSRERDRHMERRAGARRQRAGRHEAHASGTATWNAEQELGDSERGATRLTRATVPRACDTDADRVRGGSRRGAHMKVDGMLGSSFAEIGGQAKELEAADYDGAFGTETAHDAFLPLALAVAATERLEIGTSIAVAFARTPMTMAII